MNSGISPSTLKQVKSLLSEWTYFTIGMGLLALITVLDIQGLFNKPWSNLYFLIAVYGGVFLRGRIEFCLYVAIVVSDILAPIVARPSDDLTSTLMNRIAGIVYGFIMIGLIWGRRKYVAAIQSSRDDLERKVAIRTSELQSMTESLNREIAKRKRSEDEIRKSSEFRETLIRSAADGICVSYVIINHPFLAFSVWNERMTEITGYTMDEINRSGWYQSLFSDSEIRDRIQLRMERTRVGDDMRAEEWLITRKDGEQRTVAISTSGVETEQGVDGKVALMQDITLRKQTDEELRTSRQRLESLSRQLIATQEAERRHLARELHDEIGQVLTAIKMNLRRTQLAADADVRATMDENLRMVDGAIGQVRNLTLSLRPPQLDELGLVAALHWLVKRPGLTHEIQTQLEVDVGQIEIPAELQTVCFRIAQEALTNAVRHAEPQSVNVSLWAKGNQLHLSVQDDGIGFDVTENQRRASKGQSVGLISMQERANLVGGHFQIESNPEHGTKVSAYFPLSP